MTIDMLLINALLCAAICLRLILFRRAGGTHRPMASLLAYLLTVTSGAMALATLLLILLPEVTDSGIWLLMTCISRAQTVLNLVLCVAIFAMRGNVVDLFRSRNDFITDNPITRWLRKEKWL